MDQIGDEVDGDEAWQQAFAWDMFFFGYYYIYLG